MLISGVTFVEHGDESGIPVVLQHGTPASRLDLGFADARAQAAVARRAPGLTLRALLREVGDADRRHLAVLGADGLDVFTEALRQGPDGVIDDYRRWIAPWPFALEDVKTRVDVWHGDEDGGIPMHHSEDLAVRLSRATLHRLAGECHFSLVGHFGAQCSTGCWTPAPKPPHAAAQHRFDRWVDRRLLDLQVKRLSRCWSAPRDPWAEPIAD